MTEQRTVVITGAGTGIGAACARLYAQEGARLVLIGRRRAPLEQVAQDTGGLILVGDAACPQTWDGFIHQIREQHGRLDVLLACAGGHGLGSATQTSPTTWESALRSNLDSAFYSARACLPLLQESAGNIVLIGSIAALAAGPEVCGYTTAKHALLGLSRSLARDYGPDNIRVNAIAPGWIMTRRQLDLWVTPEAKTAQLGAQCLKELLYPPDIARMVLWLAADDSRMVTAQNFVVDGGRM